MPWFPSLRARRTGVPVLEEKARRQVGSRSANLAHVYDTVIARGWNPDASVEWDVDSAVRKGYERLIWVFKPVNLIGLNQSSRPYKLMQGSDEVTDHPLLGVLNGRANTLETGQQFRQRLSGQILLSKRGAFVEITKSNMGTPLRAQLLPPARTTIIPGTGDELIGWYETIDSEGKFRVVEPPDVRWFRDPHPTDPYSGVTPLEPAGLSAEMDYLARLFNISFLNNDKRPGVIISVHGDMSEKEVERLEKQFPAGGPLTAGQATVVTGDGISMVDPAPRPRDAQYEKLSAIAKIEMLSAFGVPASQVGDAGDRTYTNAAAEERIYWIQSQLPHHSIVVGGFDEDSEDGLVGGIDVDDVAVLKQPWLDDLQRAREEVAAGLRSPLSYMQLAGMGDEIEDTPATRALYMPAGRVAMPTRAADAEPLGFSPQAMGLPAPPPADQVPPGAPPPPGPGGGAPGPDDGSLLPQLDAPAERQALPAGSPQAPALPAAAPAATPAAAGGPPLPRAGTKALPRAGRPVLRLVRGAAGTKAAPAAPPPARSARWVDVPDLDETIRGRAHTALAAALAADAARWTGRAATRVGGPKARRGTRHWTADPALTADTRQGTKALDPSTAVDGDQWSDDAQQTAHPILRDAAIAAAAATILAMGDNNEDDGGLPPGVWLGHGKIAPAVLGRVAEQAVRPVLDLIGASARKQAQKVADDIAGHDQGGADMPAIVGAVRDHGPRLASWAGGLAEQAAGAAVEAARDEAVKAIGVHPDDVRRQWITRKDDKVRATHQEAHGQTVGLGEEFKVGNAALQYPCDPKGPPEETANCRCKVHLRHRRTGRYLPRAAAG